MRRPIPLSLFAAACGGAIVAAALPEATRADPPVALAVAFPCAPMARTLDAVDALDLSPAASFRDGGGDPWAIFAGPDGRVILGFRAGGVFCAIAGRDWQAVDAPATVADPVIPGARR
jgi:hypothetical protein